MMTLLQEPKKIIILDEDTGSFGHYFDYELGATAWRGRLTITMEKHLSPWAHKHIGLSLAQGPKRSRFIIIYVSRRGCHDIKD